MHETLRNPSLLTEIFDNLYIPATDEEESDVVDSKSCLSAALTCKTFFTPAMDALWRDLPEFLYLVQSIQGAEWTGGDYKSTTLYIDTPLTPPAWERIRDYARRVRTLHLPSYDHESEDLLANIDPAISMHMISLLGQVPLFPCLRTLHLEVWVNDRLVAAGSPYLASQLFISPTLQDLRFNTGHVPSEGVIHAPSLWMFLHTIVNSSPHLRSLRVCFNLKKSVLTALSRLSTLTSLELDARCASSVDCAVLQDLCDLTNLEDLSVNVLDEQPENKSGKQAHHKKRKYSFPKLTSLTLYSNIPTTHKLLTSFKFLSLHTLVFNNVNPEILSKAIPDQKSWMLLLKKFVSCLSQLTSFKIGSSIPSYPGPTPNDIPHLPWSAFAPLLSLSLTEVAIVQPPVTSLTNQNIDQLASAWPQLETLQIDTNEMGTINHEVLPKLASSLPELSTLSLSLHLPKASPASLPADVAVSRSLKDLTIPTAVLPEDPALSVKELYAIAQYLDMLFPSLSSVDCDGDSERDGLARNLEELVFGLQEARNRA